MDLLYFLSWRIAPLLLLMPYDSKSIHVRILNEEPVHIIPGANLLLRARIEFEPQEKLSMITWEHETETGPTPNRVTLATCPGSSGQCAGTKPNVLANTGEKEATLQINGYKPSDGGDYIVTLTNQKGNQTAARCIVREYEAVHHVSVSINVSHSTLVCGEAWGTDPHFSWLYNRVAITHSVGKVSQDGTTLYITKTPICGRFTCMVSNKLGYATATYTAATCEKDDNRGTIAAVVCLLLLLVCGGLLALLFWRRHQRNKNRGERLQEHLDDNI